MPLYPFGKGPPPSCLTLKPRLSLRCVASASNLLVNALSFQSEYRYIAMPLLILSLDVLLFCNSLQ